jgi:NTE family protein
MADYPRHIGYQKFQEMHQRFTISLETSPYFIRNRELINIRIGTLDKLEEMQILEKVDVLSTISGGSITGAAWCLYAGSYKSFQEQMILKLKTKSVRTAIYRSWIFIRSFLIVIILLIGSIALTFTPWSAFSFLLIIALVLLLSFFQFDIFPVSRVIEKAYNKYFFCQKTLSDLKDHPVIAIGSSNLHTGRPFTFSKKKMSDSAYAYKKEFDPPIYFKQEEFPIARAVAASTCVPFAFTPITIDKKFYKNPDDCTRIEPMLVDGGVYDNQGIQKITQRGSSYLCDIIITSDAGGNFMADKRYQNVVSLLKRTVDLFMYRIKAVQMITNIYNNAQSNKKPIAYFSLGWRIQDSIPGFVANMISGQVLQEVLDAHRFCPEWIESPKTYKDEIQQHLEDRVGYQNIQSRDLTKEEWEVARSVETDLKCLSDVQIKYLMQQARNLTELQVKLYCPNLICQ